MKDYFDGNSVFKNVYVKGEVTGRFESRIKHLYFDLKDEESIVHCLIYRWNRDKIGFEVEDGMNLLVTANVIVYPPQGKYQLDVQSATDDGLGRLFIAYQQLKVKLENEGLFDLEHKRELPKFPKMIGVVTSRGGSVIHDIITTVEKRWPYCEVLLFPAAVQGANSKRELAAQITRADDFGVDVLIVARGGGSLKELWSFNEEEVVRAIFNCNTPVISAIGHEDNVTLSDLAADKRASTPTMAAGLAIQNRDDIKNHVGHLNSRLMAFITSRLDSEMNELGKILSKPLFKDSTYIYSDEKLSFENLCSRFYIISSELINSNELMLSKIKQEYVIRRPCKMQLDAKRSNLNELSNRLIDAMDSIINVDKVNLDKATNKFKFQSQKMISSNRHALEISKSFLKTNPCKKQVDGLKDSLNARKVGLNREISLKLENDKREFGHMLQKGIIRNPDLIFSQKSMEFHALKERFMGKSNRLILAKAHDLDNIRNVAIIRNPERVCLKRADDLNRLVERFAAKSNEVILTNSYRLDSIKNVPVIKNQLDDYFYSRNCQISNLKSRLEKGYYSAVKDNRKDLSIVLSSKAFKNPEILYESKINELDGIKASKVMQNPYMLLDGYRNELKIYGEKLDKIGQVIKLKKQQQKQKATYVTIIVAIAVALLIILIVIIGGII